MNIIQRYEAEQIEKLVAARPVPPFVPGDTVRVAVKVVEGERARTQAFEGVCIARSNKGLNSNFTVRKISYGEGVERVFALYSPTIAEKARSTTGIAASSEPVAAAAVAPGIAEATATE